MSWLLGKWQRTDTKPSQVAFESWSKESDNKWAGIGVTLQGSDTVFVENLGIILQNDTIFYVAEVEHNPSAVKFKLIELSENGFIVENPSHDFPKRIEYHVNGKQLKAYISGNGKKVSFNFERVD